MRGREREKCMRKETKVVERKFESTEKRNTELFERAITIRGKKI